MPSDSPLPKGAHLTRAIGLHRQGRYDRMEAELRAELASHPDDPETLTWLALALLHLSREEEALRVVSDAIRLRPDHADAHYVRARILNRQQARQRLVGAILGVIGSRSQPDSTDLADQTEAALAEAIRLDPTSPEYLDFLADLRREQGRLVEGLEAADRGLALNPQHVGCLYNRALLLDRLDRREEARTAFLAGLALAPEHAGLHRHLGELLLRMDAAGPAVEHLRESLRLQPDQEANIRPLIAEGLKRRSRVYAWFVDHLASPWLLVVLFSLPLAALYLGDDLGWRVTDIMRDLLIPAIGYLLLLFSALSAIDPLYHLWLARTPFGQLMLSAREIRQSSAVAACLVGFLLAVVWALLMPDKVTPVILALFCLFWISPVAESFTLHPESLRRIASVCTILSIVLVLIHLTWRWFSPDDPAHWRPLFPYLALPLGVGYFLVFVPFILSRSAGDFSFWRPRSRRRAVVVFWSLLLLCWFVLVAGSFGAFFVLPDGKTFHAIRQYAQLAGIAFGLVLYFETSLIDWLAKRL